MNTSTNTKQAYDATKITMRTTPTGFRRRTMAGALLVMALTASAVGFAATSHADDDTAAPPSAAALPWPPPPPWLDGIIDRALHPHLQCSQRGFYQQFRCFWY